MAMSIGQRPKSIGKESWQEVAGSGQRADDGGQRSDDGGQRSEGWQQPAASCVLAGTEARPTEYFCQLPPARCPLSSTFPLPCL